MTLVSRMVRDLLAADQVLERLPARTRKGSLPTISTSAARGLEL